MDGGHIGIRITFDDLTSAEATRAVQDLRHAMLDRVGDGVVATIESDDTDSQDAGATLALLFGTSLAIAVAQGIRAYLARWADQRDQITIKTIDGTTIIATGEPARRIDAVMLLRIARAASPSTSVRSGTGSHDSPSRGSKSVILFLAANPIDTDRLALDREAREIQVELERSGYRDCFEFVSRWAAEPLDLLRELRKLKPTVVHFSGHGGQRVPRDQPSSQAVERVRRAPGREVADDQERHGGELEHGLYFQDTDGRAQIVSSAVLGETFGAVSASVKVVVLNACYSDAHARALRAHVDCIVGMTGAIDDVSARIFAIGFYGGVGGGESVAVAFRQGCAAISLEGLRDSDRPRLEVRGGVDATKIFLAAGDGTDSPTR
jgi:hypothetical protein